MAIEGDEEENPIRGTEEYHILYTPSQIEQFIGDNATRLEDESREDIEDYLTELSRTDWIEYPALHCSGHHALALTRLAMMASDSVIPDDEIEGAEDEDKQSLN